MNIKQLYERLETWFNNQNQNMRVMLTMLTGIVLCSTWYLLIVILLQSNINETYHKEKQQLTTANKLKPQVQSMQDKIKQFKQQNTPDKIEDLKKRLKFTEHKLQAYTSQYAPTQQLYGKLKSFLVKAQGVNLIGIEHQKPKRIQIPESDSQLHLWRHQIDIIFEGSYYQTLEYLQLITKLDIYVVIESLDYKVEQFPKAKVEMTLSTITEKKQ